MKIKDNYYLQAVADEFVVVPIAEEADRLHGVIKLNEVGAFLWRRLEQSASTDDLTSLLMQEYGIDAETARRDVISFLNKLESIGCINSLEE